MCSRRLSSHWEASLQSASSLRLVSHSPGVLLLSKVDYISAPNHRETDLVVGQWHPDLYGLWWEIPWCQFS